MSQRCRSAAASVCSTNSSRLGRVLCTFLSQRMDRHSVQALAEGREMPASALRASEQRRSLGNHRVDRTYCRPRLAYPNECPDFNSRSDRRFEIQCSTIFQCFACMITSAVEICHNYITRYLHELKNVWMLAEPISDFDFPSIVSVEALCCYPKQRCSACGLPHSSSAYKYTMHACSRDIK